MLSWGVNGILCDNNAEASPVLPSELVLNQVRPTRFSRQVAWTLAARILAVGASVIVGVIIARTVGVEGVGVYAVITLTVNTLVQIIGAGLASANLYFVKRDPSITSNIIANALVFAVIGGIAGAAITFGIYNERPDWFHHVARELFLMGLVMLPFQIWTLFGLNILFGWAEVRLANILDSSAQLLLLFNAVIVLMMNGGGIGLLITFNAAAAVIAAAAVAVFLFRKGGVQAAELRPSLSTFGWMMRFGLKINVMNAALALILRSDVLLVNYFRGQAETGIYSVATQCSLLLIMFPNVVGTMLFPNVAGMETEDSATFTARIIRHAAAIQIILCVLSIPISFLLPFVYGEAFGPATFQFLILLPGAVMMGLQMMLSQHLVGIGKIEPLPYFWIATFLVSVTLNLWLIPEYGAIGAAMVSSVAYFLIFTLTLAYFHRETGEAVANILFLRRADVRKQLARMGW
jgi:O-antigen/teichoic acid export membrane protein